MFRRIGLWIGLLAAIAASAAACSPVQAGERGSGIPWWAWVLIIIVVLVLFVWWWLIRRAVKKEGPAVTVETASPSRGIEAAAPAVRPAPPIPAEVEPPTPDDLRRIEGIGPKISGLLQAAGVTTFAQLAEIDVSRVQQIVRDAGITVADPATWPEQAGLAAAGKWDELEILQDELKGGRRV